MCVTWKILRIQWKPQYQLLLLLHFLRKFGEENCIIILRGNSTQLEYVQDGMSEAENVLEIHNAEALCECWHAPKAQRKKKTRSGSFFPLLVPTSF